MQTSQARRRIFLTFFLLFLVALGLCNVLAVTAKPAAGLPPDVVVETVAAGLNFPVALASAPDGKLFFTEKPGFPGASRSTAARVQVIQFGPDGTPGLPSTFVTVTVDDWFERGLLGIALDPGWPGTRSLYVFYTQPGTPAVNRVVRYTADATGLQADSAIAPVELLNVPTTGCGNHNGGNLHFGRDGKLYISIGDNACDSAVAQSLSNPRGKIHRVEPGSGAPVAGNPFFDDSNPTTGQDDRIWAYGLRNPFDFTFRPNSGQLWATENGPSVNDEIDIIQPGKNYGWPMHTGGFSNTLYTGSVYTYPNPIGITGIAFYTGLAIPQFTGKMFHCAVNDGKMRMMTLAGDTITTSEVVIDPGLSIHGQSYDCRVDVLMGPDQALYFTGDNAIYRIRKAGFCGLLSDFNADNRIDVFDVQTVASHFGQVWSDPGFNDLYDVNGNSQVDPPDIQALAARWRQTCTPP